MFHHVLIISGRRIGHYMNINLNSDINLKGYLIHVYTKYYQKQKKKYSFSTRVSEVNPI